MAKGKAKIEDRIEALRLCVEQQDKAQALQCIKDALKDKSNFVVAKAAQWSARRFAYDAIDDLVAAFERFLDNPIKTDKTCAAKSAIARALYELDYDNTRFFGDYLRYRQMEPVWGGSVDAAVDLRCTCALGLAASSDQRIILDLVDLMHDDERQARIGAIKALEMVNPFHAEILIRNKILEGDNATEVITQCFESLMKVAAEESLPFVSRYLDNDNEVFQASAALAMGESRLDEALDMLIDAGNDLSPFDPLLPSLYQAIALQRKEKAYEFLLDKIATADEKICCFAIESLALYSFKSELKNKVEGLVDQRGSDNITNAYERYWGKCDPDGK